MTVYLGKRDFIDHCDGNIDPVEGVVSVEKDYLKGRKVYGEVFYYYIFLLINHRYRVKNTKINVLFTVDNYV